MTKQISEAEKILKKELKNGEMKALDNSMFEDIWDEVEQDMEDYRIENNYKKGKSIIDSENVLIKNYSIN